MFRNYIVAAYRNLLKKKFFSLLNILGLAVGMAACLLIFQYVTFERSFDRYNEHADDLYRITLTYTRTGEDPDRSANTWYELAPAFEDAVPGLVEATRFHPNYGSMVVSYTPAEGTPTVFTETQAAFVDPSFLSMFTVPFVTGDPATVLRAPQTLVLSASMARKYFGDADPMGQVVEVRGWVEGPYTVTGVFEDLPAHSHLRLDFLLPMEDLLRVEQYQTEGSGLSWSNFLTYVRLRPDAPTATVETAMTEVVERLKAEDIARDEHAITVSLQPLLDIHLYSDVSAYPSVTTSYRTVYFFTIIAFFILLIAWVNYINLATARALERAREVGVRKAVGARKGQLVTQFLFESVLTNGIALVLALTLAAALRTTLNDLADTAIPASVWYSVPFWLVFLGVFGLGAVLAGLYPAFFLSSFQPVKVLKGAGGRTAGRTLLRKGLVVFQFAASVALLTGTYIVYAQLGHMRNADLGLTLDQTLFVEGPRILDEGVDYAALIQGFKEELLRAPNIYQAASSSTVPGGGFNLYTSIRRESRDPADAESGRMTHIDYDFVDLFGLELVAGRLFSRDRPSDLEEHAVLINETAARNLGFDSPEEALTEKVYVGSDEPVDVIGVLKDFNWMAVREETDPVIFNITEAAGRISLKVSTDNLPATLDRVQALYSDFFPGNPFEYHFLDDYFDRQYQEDQRFALLFGLFASFAVLVACLGLMGLAAFTTRQRTKEIGVRKAMGANTTDILRLLVREFIVLVGVGFLVAAPLMYVAMNAWLEDFAVRIPLTPLLFLFPGLAVLLLAVLTVSYHTTAVAVTNPARSLRYE